MQGERTSIPYLVQTFSMERLTAGSTWIVKTPEKEEHRGSLLILSAEPQMFSGDQAGHYLKIMVYVEIIPVNMSGRKAWGRVDALKTVKFCDHTVNDRQYPGS